MTYKIELVMLFADYSVHIEKFMYKPTGFFSMPFVRYCRLVWFIDSVVDSILYEEDFQKTYAKYRVFVLNKVESSTLKVLKVTVVLNGNYYGVFKYENDKFSDFEHWQSVLDAFFGDKKIKK